MGQNTIECPSKTTRFTQYQPERTDQAWPPDAEQPKMQGTAPWSWGPEPGPTTYLLGDHGPSLPSLNLSFLTCTMWQWEAKGSRRWSDLQEPLPALPAPTSRLSPAPHPPGHLGAQFCEQRGLLLTKSRARWEPSPGPATLWCLCAPYCHLETLRASYLQAQTLSLFLQPEADWSSQMWGAVQHVCFNRHHIQNTAPLSDHHPAWTLKVDPPAPTMLRTVHQVRANGAAATLWPKIPVAPT